LYTTITIVLIDGGSGNMFRTIESRVATQKSKVQIVSLGLIMTLLMYSVLSALTPFVASSVYAGGGYDPNAPTVYDEGASGSTQSGSGGSGASSDDEAKSGDKDKESSETGSGSGANQNEENANGEATASSCASFMGLCWYWWIPIAVAVAGVAAFVVRQRREEA
jgi:hypothetical protein